MHPTPHTTDPGMVPGGPVGPAPPPGRPTRRIGLALGVVGVGLLVVVLILANIPLKEYGLSPGSALVVDGPAGAITVKQAHPGGGRLFFTTVLLQNRVTVWDRVTSFLHPDTQYVPKADVTGGVSDRTFQQQNAQEMTDSQLAAKVAALRRLGYAVPEHGDGALIVDVAQGTPADGPLHPGDVIFSVNGHPVAIESDVTAAVRADKVGDSVSLTVHRPAPAGAAPPGGTPGTAAAPSTSTPAGPAGSAPTAPARPPGTTVALSLRLVACGSRCPGDPARPLIGISLQTDNQSFELPQEVGLSIAANGVGGPSAGLAFTLGAIDALTSHNLTGGHKVAVTGTIDPDGTVGDVGGVAQKTVAVEREHAEYFLVPTSELATARAKARGHHLTIVPVATLDDALRFLQSIHGDLSGVPAAPAGSSG